ncbi:FecR family protein [Phyllobacterium sp. K27]
MGRKSSDEDAPQDIYTHPDPIADEALEWFARLQTGGRDPAVVGEFEAWLAADPRHSVEFRKLQAIWGSSELEGAAKRVGRQLKRPGGSILSRGEKQSFQGRWTVGVAGLAAMLIVLIFVHQLPMLMLQWRADYISETGKQTTVTLPDGSTMILNTDSAASIDFDGSRRNVTLLQGEAYFNVIRDPDHPFQVTSAFTRVEAKGTAFSVRMESSSELVVLEHGRVGVTLLSDSRDSVDLEPGQIVTATEHRLSRVTSVDTATEFAWLQGRMSFYDQPFSQVIARLQRYYRGHIILADAQIGQTIVSGNYRLDDPEGAIRSLAAAAKANMTQLPGGIIILR